MAQTIAIVRGTTSVTAFNNVLLFTQSASTATRVIVNMVSFHSSGGQWSGPSASVYMTSSSGGNAIIGYWKTAGSLHQGNFMPAASGYGPMSSTGVGTSANPIAMSGAMCANDGSQTYIGPVYPANLQTTASTSRESFMPSNFWLGSGDTVRFGWYDNNSNSAIIAYSFTTITES